MRAQLVVLTALTVPTVLPAQGTGFVVTLGRDTVALERLARRATGFEGELFLITPRTTRIRYTAVLDAKGHIARFQQQSGPAVETPPAGTSSVVTEVQDTLATVIRTRINAQGTRVDTTRLAVRPGAVPFISYSTALLEQMTLQARRAGGDSVPIQIFLAGQRQATPNFVARRGRDSVAIDYFGTPFWLKVDGEGRVLGLNGIRTTSKVVVARVADLDFDRVAQAFIARERAGQVAGQMSPRDTARSAAGGATVWVDYGRPAKRGRVIHGGIVPWDQVWRTGANAATQLNTSVDLQVGDAVIPAGKYTLWTLPSVGGVRLIVNKQTGQWGTEYDAAQDLLRLDLKVEPLPGTVEQFTIAVVDLGGAGEIRFDWDRTRWILPFRIR